MPFYAQELGASPVQLGNIFSAFAITQVISQAWMGYAGDKIGRRAVLLIALIGPSFGFAASALAWDFWSLMFARASSASSPAALRPRMPTSPRSSRRTSARV